MLLCKNLKLHALWRKIIMLRGPTKAFQTEMRALPTKSSSFCLSKTKNKTKKKLFSSWKSWWTQDDFGSLYPLESGEFEDWRIRVWIILKNRINLNCSVIWFDSSYYFLSLLSSLNFCLKVVLDSLKDDHNLRGIKKQMRNSMHNIISLYIQSDFSEGQEPCVFSMEDRWEWHWIFLRVLLFQS